MAQERGDARRAAGVEALIRPLDRESHALRGWDAAKEPGFFLQQLRNRCFEMGIEDVRERAEAKLEEQRRPWLRERIRTSRESTSDLPRSRAPFGIGRSERRRSIRRLETVLRRPTGKNLGNP